MLVYISGIINLNQSLSYNNIVHVHHPITLYERDMDFVCIVMKPWIQIFMKMLENSRYIIQQFQF